MFSVKRFKQLAGILKEQVELENEPKVIVSYYETWSPEDMDPAPYDMVLDDDELSDDDDVFDEYYLEGEKGELDVHKIELDEHDREKGLTEVDLAVDYLKDKGALEASSYRFYPGVSYTAYGDTDRTGARTNESYHLKGFSDEEEAEIFDRMVR
jgi:hypothetical protein